MNGCSKVYLLDNTRNKDDLYNLVKLNKYIAEDVIEDLNLLMEDLQVISRSNINITNKNLLFELISKRFNKSIGYIKLLINFLKREDMVKIEQLIEVTEKGSILKYVDRYNLTVELIRFLLFEAEWQDYFDKRDIYISTESRKYLFAMLSQVDDKFISSVNALKDNLLFNSSYFGTIIKINSSLAFKSISKDLFCRLNLGNIKDDCFVPNSIGKAIFSYYSKDLIQQYYRLMDECWDYFDRGDFEQAYDISRSIIKLLLFIPEAYNVLGCVYIKTGEIQKARDVLNYAIEIYEKTSFGNIDTEAYILLYYNLGLSYYYMNENFKALKIFTKLKSMISFEIDNLDELIKEIKSTLVNKGTSLN